MITELILSCILGVLVAIWFELRKPCEATGSYAKPREATGSAPPVDGVHLLIGAPGDWRYHSSRPEGHRDIAEALATPGMAVRRDGTIEEGTQ